MRAAMKVVCVGGMLLVGMAIPAAAATIPLILETPGLVNYQQTANRPCIIGEASCKGADPNGLYYGEIPNGSPNDYDVFSDAYRDIAGIQEYTVGALTALVGNAPIVGIDVNTASGQPIEILLEFNVWINGLLAFQYTGSTGFILANNGNGYSDALLRGIDLSNYAATDLIKFEAIVTSATDGKEQFFLINGNAPPDPAPVPEPASLAFLGAGLAMLGVGFRRRLRRQQ